MLPKFPEFSLTLEQQFDLRKFQAMLKDISRNEIEELFIMILRQKMAQENITRSLIKECLLRDFPEVSSSTA
ncbi:phycobilisome degradation protein NblA [Lyngbya confervoides]|uniref:Phycobilisome degradation protein nblA n=1 Tax=Lyngbya confervoides BDU141951 TaxID=1574623 RepID=A0ABD4SZX3_9CYAN|nr:NblA/ycf18 family protein [Lyngbya confervoides]MCM1981818.1 phycobilisome degradation protein nblA [Lyngbya confervoides BDU141951]